MPLLSRTALVVGLLGCAVYLNTLPNEFAYDDLPVIYDNPRITSLLNVHDIWWTDWWYEGADRSDLRHRDILYRPLVMHSFAFNYAISGRSAWSYHALNVLLHGLTCVVFVALSARLFGDRRLAWWMGLVFAVLPIHVEAVANVVGRANVMATLFCLGGLWCLTREHDLRAVGDGRGLGRAGAWRWAALLCVPLGLFCKEEAICLPALMLLTEWHLRRAGGQATGRRTGVVGILRSRWWGFYVWTIVGVAGYLLMRYFACDYRLVRDVPTAILDNPLSEAVWLERFWTPFKVLGTYLLLTVWPALLSSDYSYNALPLVSAPADGLTLLGLAAVLGGIAAGVRSRRGSGEALFAVLFFALSYALVSNTLLLVGTILGERLFYLPSVGVCWMAGFGVRALLTRLRRGPQWTDRHLRLVRGLGVAVLVVLGARAIVRNFDWRDGESLFAADVRTNPQSARLQLFYARDLIRAEQWESAEEHIRMALEIYDEYGDAWGNLAHVRAVRGDLAEAKKCYRLALQMTWDNPALQAEYEVFRRVFEEGGASPARDLAAAEESARATPGDAKVLRRLADLQSGLGRYREAIHALRRVVALEPNDRRARFALANVLMIDEQYAAAAEQLEWLIADDETDWRAHTHLAIARAEDDPAAAVVHARRAVELAPDEMEPHINLAQALISAKREPEALAVLRELSVRIPRDEPAHQVVRRQIELLEHRR